MTIRTFDADADPNATLLELKTLLSVAKTSDHFTPSVLVVMEKAFAGNSH
jgi:hypothetical protein